MLHFSVNVRALLAAAAGALPRSAKTFLLLWSSVLAELRRLAGALAAVGARAGFPAAGGACVGAAVAAPDAAFVPISLLAAGPGGALEELAAGALEEIAATGPLSAAGPLAAADPKSPGSGGKTSKPSGSSPLPRA